MAKEDALLETDGETVVGVLNIKNARLKRLHIKDETRYVWGFTLMAKGALHEFFHQEKIVCETWVQQLKLSVVLLDLKDTYAIEQLIGKGNFAKVHSCHNKLSQEKFALKSIEKSLIKKNKRNSTSMLSEIDILRRVEHKHVIKMFEVYESDKYVHLVLEML